VEVRNDEFRDDNDDVGPSCLIAVHRSHVVDLHHAGQMLRELEIINKRTRSELGTADSAGLKAVPKRRPFIPETTLMSKASDQESTEEEVVRLQHLAMAAVATVGAGGSAKVVGSSGGPVAAAVESGSDSRGNTVDPRYVAPRVINGKLIMPFFNHSFSSYCFETMKCRVLYRNRYDVIDDERTGPLTEDVRKNLGAHWMLFDLPSVARVSWVSKDGASHDEMIDLGEIFSSRLVRYAPDLDVGDVDLDVYYGGPEVILVVEDRSIHVYMKSRIVLSHPVSPSNRLSNVRSDLIVAYTHEF
jgi:hypothetical protein